jgi:hypothetical protein
LYLSGLHGSFLTNPQNFHSNIIKIKLMILLESDIGQLKNTALVYFWVA